MSSRTLTLTTLLSLLVIGCASAPAPAPMEEPPQPLAGNRIPAIQGRAHTSPLVGKTVDKVEGVVTVLMPAGRTPGFWMQERRGDDDLATSDAIYVVTEGLDTKFAVRDAVLVTGVVEEFASREGSLTTTQIKASAVEVIASDRTLPDPIVIGLKGRRVPAVIATKEMKQYRPKLAAMDFWESLEGMLVEIQDPVVVGPTSRYGDMVVLADGGAGSEIRSPRGGVVFQDYAPNPERITLDGRLTGRLPEASVGDRFEGAVSGVIDYGYGNYRLLPTSPLGEPIANPMPPEVTRLRGSSDRLTIATYNVLNLSATSDEQRFAAVAKSIAVNLGAPDVIGLQEMQDDSGPEDDGVVTAEKTFAKLIDAIVAAGGPRYDYRQIDPSNNQDGGQPGGNIRVGILFNPERVTFVDRGSTGPEEAVSVEGEGVDVRLSRSPGRVDPTNPCFAGAEEGAEPTRKSLAAELRFDDWTFFVVVNHLKSKRGDDGLFSPVQPPVLRTEEQRTCQATVIGSFVAGILEKNADARVIVLGDMNEHEFREPMKKLAEVSGLANLHDRVIVADRYTYIYEGNAQVLDHIFVSKSLLDEAEVDIVHVNADFADAVAASDHDPIVARLKM